MTNPLMVGYLESWGTITFTQAAEQGYDCIAMAFGAITGTTVEPYQGSFNPSPTPEALKEDISNAKAKGAKQILFSVGGGENNTYNPNGASAEDVASAVVSYLNDYGFTGIDFDLEIDTDAEYLDQLCASIKEKDDSLIITAAPQVNQDAHGTDLFLVTTGTYQCYNTAVANKRFDYLFIQAYNNPWPALGPDDKVTQEYAEFISEGFKNLKNCIPAETMIVMGEPATADAAGTSPFTGPENGPEIYDLMAKQYTSINSDPQFGGAMTWDINYDAGNNDQWVKTIKPALGNSDQRAQTIKSGLGSNDQAKPLKRAL